MYKPPFEMLTAPPPPFTPGGAQVPTPPYPRYHAGNLISVYDAPRGKEALPARPENGL